MKKAQIEHVFLYLFVLLIMGVLALIGYKAIAKINEGGCTADKETFKTDLLSAVEEYDRMGSVHVEKLHTPCGFDQICFLDADTILSTEGVPGSMPCMASTSPTPCVIVDAAHTDSKTNVFMSKQNTWEAAGWSEKIETNATGNYVCIKAKGSNFNILFEGLGRRTRIPWPQ